MTILPTRDLGDSLRTSAQGFGAMALTNIYGESDEVDDLRTLNHAIDVGVTLIDTADIYGAGENEKLISKLLARRRNEVTLATKFGISGSIAEKKMRTRGDAAYVRAAADASLTRLDTDVIDLYYLHRREVSVPIEETVGAMAELVAAGKVRHLGLSEVTAEELETASAVHPIAAIQSEWSVWSRDVEQTVVPTAARLGVGFVPYSPLGRGFLTGTLSDPSSFAGDWRSGLSRFTGSAFDVNQAVVQTIASIGAEIGATPAQVALAWLYGKGREFGLSVVPIPGTRRATRIDENSRAVDILLTTEQVEALDSVSARVVGPRSDSDDPNWTSDGREKR